MTINCVDRSVSIPTKYPYLFAIRGYAILGVIAVHSLTFGPYLSGVEKTMIGEGARGVQLFFVASAITLCMSWKSRNDGVVPFYLRRLFRVAPMFWLAIVAFVLIDGFGPRFWAPKGIGWQEILSTTFFIHGLHPIAINSVVPGGWSISVEMIFYLLFPVLIWLCRSLLVTSAVLIGSMLLADGLGWRIQAFWAAHLPVEEASAAQYYAGLWFPAQLPVFMAGLVSFQLIQRLPLSLPRMAKDALLLITFSAILLWPAIPTWIRPGMSISWLIRPLTDQNPFAHSLRPIDMMRQGWLSSFRQASQQWSTMSS